MRHTLLACGLGATNPDHRRTLIVGAPAGAWIANTGAGALMETSRNAERGSSRFPFRLHTLLFACLVLAAACGDSEPGITDPDGGNEFVPSYASVFAGMRHTCALDASGAAYCWGFNDEGQVWGAPGSDTGLLPGRLPGTLRYDMMSPGSTHTCGVSEGSLHCWGQTPWGSRLLEPTRIETPLAFTEADSRFNHVCAVTTDARVACLGRGESGQLGTGEHGEDVVGKIPVVVDSMPEVESVVTGVTFSCALDRAGQVWCWGAHDAGALGIGDAETGPCSDGGVPYACVPRPVPVQQPQPFVDVAAGYYHACGLTQDGAVFCWGDQTALQAGSPEIPPQECTWAGGAIPPRPCHLAPVQVAAGDLQFRSIHAGGFHTCGITSAGTAHCWGSNSFGQLGSGGSSPDGPRAVSGTLVWRDLAMGQAHTCGITLGGEAYCWGAGSHGQLGSLLEVSFAPARVRPPIV